MARTQNGALGGLSVQSHFTRGLAVSVQERHRDTLGLWFSIGRQDGAPGSALLDSRLPRREAVAVTF